MKVIKGQPPVQFVPVSIILESQEEVIFLSAYLREVLKNGIRYPDRVNPKLEFGIDLLQKIS